MLMGHALRTVSLILAGAVLLAACETEAEPPSRQAGPILVLDGRFGFDGVCMVDSEFSVGGVALDAAEQDVIATLGPPLSRQSSPALQDLWIDEQLRYDGLLVDVFLGHVVGFELTDPQWRTPSGLYLGMAESELLERFGMPIEPTTDFRGETYYRVYFCSFDEPRDLGSFFQFDIDADRTVSRAWVATGTP